MPPGFSFNVGFKKHCTYKNLTHTIFEENISTSIFKKWLSLLRANTTLIFVIIIETKTYFKKKTDPHGSL